MTPTHFSWLYDTFRALPLAIFVFFGLGLPLAWLLLPRRDWGHKALVSALAILCGSMGLTVWMFLLGTLASVQNRSLLQFPLIMVGLLVLGIVGWGLAFIKRRRTTAIILQRVPFSSFERILILGMVLAVVGVFLASAFWTFSAYDTLWVYGYEGRLYTLTHSIPTTISYYPQFIPLQYAFYQLAFGEINDHLARVIVPFMHMGSILACYSLGSRLFESRRIGLFTAIIWAFYPHVGQWAQMGDLEIPLTYTFTLSATFFLMAWHEPRQIFRRQYALIAGIVFGITLWTKPTAGAFVWGVLLLVVVEFIRAKAHWSAWYSRFEVAVITGLACLPLGAAWYVRNILLGYKPIDFPHPNWLTLATRSGDLFGWLLLALCLMMVFLVTQRRDKAPWTFFAMSGLGTAVILLGVLPSNPLLNPARLNPPTSYITPIEWGAIGLGMVLIGVALWRYKRQYATSDIWTATGRIFYALLLALPYFLTWFYAYSYHYRLSFAIVPLLILPSAVILSQFGAIWQNTQLKRIANILVGLLVVAIAFIPLTGATADQTIDYLWSGRFPDDKAKYLYVNAPLALLVDKLTDYEQTTGMEPIVVAPGEQQLPFFFPLMTITTKTTPTQLHDLDKVTHYLYGTLAGWRYADEGITPDNNQIVSALGREDVMTQVFYHTDATFQYELYEVHATDRYKAEPVSHMLDEDIVVGGFARLLGDELSTTELFGNTVYLTFLWEVTAEPLDDYWTFFNLVNATTGEVVYRWEAPVAKQEHGYYTTRVWELGETIRDARTLSIPAELRGTIPIGQPYRLQVGMFRVDDPAKAPLEITINGRGQPYYELVAPFTYGG